MKIRIALSAATLICAFQPVAEAQSTKSVITASNGVAVTLNADDFAARYEYSAPSVDLAGSPSGFALVAKIKNKGAVGGMTIQGAVFYSGEWHYYSSALFKGGDPAKYTSTSRDVVSCSGGCSYSEGFIIDISPADVAKHTENGILAIQLRPTASSETVIFNIPRTYIDAVNEVTR